MVFSEKYSGTTTSQTQSGQTFARQHNPNYREGRPKRKKIAVIQLSFNILKLTQSTQ
ncbi:hypothetical protein [Lactobacillus helveticus] [Leuconostoc pseudomesenteroides]|nr:hypothetical protein [Lactobacillus helveticus] [Leuconostoc pseudomesenteroides]